MIEQLIPLHPKLVHFPIALMITAFILDILSRIYRQDKLHEAALVVYIAGVLFTPVVVWAGMWEQQRLHLNHPLLSQHKLYAFVTMWVTWLSLPVLWFLRKRSLQAYRVMFSCLLLCLAMLVTVTGFYGGKMVYEYGAGVNQ